MVPDPAGTTARNLYAIFYCKDHQVTNAEFTRIWQKLDKTTLKIYESESRKLRNPKTKDLPE
ncbi:hypothetical protein CPB83DRAFT_858136 [Crepidotus variabilis]|uniref:Uncharacterized protein n=1 Tax=Crepidotus variabilis TaxID=179855 RepID=A0A9P6EC68_9AGAR|nr:hypothetical protein CPB83DRAFT_858136 [Crepidotus variabilis]